MKKYLGQNYIVGIPTLLDFSARPIHGFQSSKPQKPYIFAVKGSAVYAICQRSESKEALRLSAALAQCLTS